MSQTSYADGFATAAKKSLLVSLWYSGSSGEIRRVTSSHPCISALCFLVITSSTSQTQRTYLVKRSKTIQSCCTVDGVVTVSTKLLQPALIVLLISKFYHTSVADNCIAISQRLIRNCDLILFSTEWIFCTYFTCRLTRLLINTRRNAKLQSIRSPLRVSNKYCRITFLDNIIRGRRQTAIFIRRRRTAKRNVLQR